MRIRRKLFDYNGNYPGLVEVYNAYAGLLIEQGDYDEAKEYADMSLWIALTRIRQHVKQHLTADLFLLFHQEEIEKFLGNMIRNCKNAEMKLKDIFAA